MTNKNHYAGNPYLFYGAKIIIPLRILPYTIATSTMSFPPMSSEFDYVYLPSTALPPPSRHCQAAAAATLSAATALPPALPFLPSCRHRAVAAPMLPQQKMLPPLRCCKAVAAVKLSAATLLLPPPLRCQAASATLLLPPSYPRHAVTTAKLPLPSR